MRQVYNQKGQQFQLIETTKKGGEATIWEVNGDPNLLAKIYENKKRTLGQEYELKFQEKLKFQEHKLKFMVANPPRQNQTKIVWPTHLLYERNQSGQNQFVGFLMPYIQGSDEILNFCNPNLRKEKYPHINQKSLYDIALKLAIAVSKVHSQGYVIGDINIKDFFVNAKTLSITFIDTDSFQIVNQRRVYRCPVFTAEYTPPELQNVTHFEKFNRTTIHDNFGLAILIFQLLMDGLHPFQNRGVPGEQNHIKAIKQGIFPYRNKQGIKPPPHAPSFERLHPKVQAAFIRCFVDGYHNPNLRPTAKEWPNILKISNVPSPSISVQRNYHPVKQKIRSKKSLTSLIPVGLIFLFIVIVMAIFFKSEKVIVDQKVAEVHITKAQQKEVEQLIEKLKNDEDFLKRKSSAEALGKLGVKSAKVINVLIEKLENEKEWYVRKLSAEALGKLGVKSDEVINALLERLKNDTDGVVVMASIEALGKLGVKSEKVVNALIKKLEYVQGFYLKWFARESAAKALGNLGEKSAKVINALIKSLKNDIRSVRSSAAIALGKLGVKSDEVINALLVRLKNDTDGAVRRLSAQALGKLGVKSDKVINALIERLENDKESWYVRESSAQALGNLGEKSDKVINALIKSLKNDIRSVRSSAAIALGNLGVKNAKVINALLERLENDKESIVRDSVAKALGNLEQEHLASQREETKKRELAQKLRECKKHFQANRLTTGKGGTALACYQAVLKKEANNTQALTGLKNIEARYVTWIKRALDKRQENKAEQHLAGLRRVNPQSSQLAELEAQFSRRFSSNHYTDNGNGTVTNNKTGLIWLKNANCFGKQNWKMAMRSAAKLAHGQCGLRDGSKAEMWRLPTKEEWKAMIDKKYVKWNWSQPAISNAAGTGPWKEGDAFSGVQRGSYWSSTGYTKFAWYMSIIGGGVSLGAKTSTFYVWPVRGGV
ncbi:MAG: HEAT repeat domain-containing protein [Thiomargarita sp.]|nr:HEAT repeat domain-containing protein [Thiomargarita sp.]